MVLKDRLFGTLCAVAAVLSLAAITLLLNDNALALLPTAGVVACVFAAVKRKDYLDLQRRMRR